MGKDNQVEPDKIRVRDQYENLWRCRDFELSHLWQRSVFLSAMLLLCFMGYGSLFKIYLSFAPKSCEPEFNFVAWHAIAVMICVAATWVSALWIMMGKASKLWYERYERAIDAFVQVRESAFVVDELKTPELFAGFSYADTPGYERPQADNRLFSTKGGHYSPSKINIMIGQLSLIAWGFLLVIHSMFVVYYAMPSTQEKAIDIFWLNVLVPVIATIWGIKRITKKKNLMSVRSSCE